jgi:tubulin-specific chaperone B
MTVDDVKAKVCAMTGTSALASQLQLLDPSGRVVAPSLGGVDGSPAAPPRKLGYYGAQTGWRLHLVDHDHHSLAATGWLEDTSKVEKYVMADDEYDKRAGTYRAYRRARLAADPAWTLEGEMRARREAKAKAGAAGGEGGAAAEEAGVGAGAAAAAAAAGCCGEAAGPAAASASSIAVGDRCSVAPGDRRGCVAYVGPAPDLGPGDWIGVVYDEPVGKHDGVPKPGAARLFRCAPRHGGVLRLDRVAVGDYPAVGLGSDGGEEEDESSDLGSGDEI